MPEPPFIMYKFKKQNLENNINKLEVLNPLNTLKRGYSIVRKEDKIITTKKDINKDDIIDINIQDGIIKTKVIEIGD